MLGLDGSAQPHGCFGHQSSRLSVHALETEVVPEARGNHLAILDVLRQIGALLPGGKDEDDSENAHRDEAREEDEEPLHLDAPARHRARTVDSTPSAVHA